MPETWLVTGGCGFIGTSLLSKLVEVDKSKNIIVLDDLSVGREADLNRVIKFDEVKLKDLPYSSDSQYRLVIGDITDRGLVNSVVSNVDVIIHLAANTGVPQSIDDPVADFNANVIGTFNLLDAARSSQVDKFIFASSSAPLGETEPPVHEEIAPHPISPYGASKLAGEGYCSAFYRSFGLETVALRFGNVFGKHSLHKQSVVAKFAKQAIDGDTLEIYGDGNQTRDFIYVDDLVRAIILSVETEGIGGEIFQIASNLETTVSELCVALCEELEQLGVNSIQVVHREIRAGDMKRNFSNTQKAKEILGWQPEYDLRTGLKEISKHFVSTYGRV